MKCLDKVGWWNDVRLWHKVVLVWYL